ncbi:MAG: hypothetical protein ACRC2T_18235 [Thermoguttaceae bacterium]
MLKFRNTSKTLAVIKSVPTLLMLVLACQTVRGAVMTPQKAQDVFVEAARLFENNELQRHQMELDTKITETHTENEAKLLNEKKELGERFIRLEFNRIAAMYQGIIDSGVESGPIFYNQGNAWLCGGEPAKALASYRLAEKYMPLNPYLQSNIKLVSQAESPINRVLFGNSFVSHLLFWQNITSYPTKLKIAVSLTTVIFVIGVLRLYILSPGTNCMFSIIGNLMIFSTKHWKTRGKSRPTGGGTFNAKRTAHTGLRYKNRFVLISKTALRPVIIMVLLLATTLGLLSAVIDWHRFEHSKYCVVNTDDTVARKGNSADYEPVTSEPLSKCAEFIVRDERGDWLQIELANGSRGWIPKTNAILY